MSGLLNGSALDNKNGVEGTLNSKYGEAATLDQIEAEIERLSNADWTRLRRMAERHLWGTRLVVPDELINETIGRLIEGTRRWPTGMKFVPWMDSAMKSVSDGIRNIKSRKIEALAGDLIGCDESEEALDVFGEDVRTPLDSMLTEEARKAAAEALEKIGGHFMGDQDVEWILMGFEDGLKAEEIRVMGGMTQTQYETARKRIRRGVERLFPTRRKP